MLTIVLALALTGTVKSLDGVPVPGATVVLTQGARADTTATDTAGAFVFPDAALPAVIEVSAAGFTTVRRLVDRLPVTIVLAPAGLRESILVSAASAPAPWRDAATGQTVLSSRDLEHAPGVTLDEALHVVSGFSLFRRSSSRASNPTTHGVTMRGLSASGASRGLVLLDGIPLNDGFGGWVTWTRLPPLAIERVELDRGSEGETFGTDALGGVINVVTPSGRGSSVTMAGQAGSMGVGGVDLAARRAVGRVSMFGAASGFRTSGAIPVEPASRGPVDRPADAHWVNGLGRATLGWKGQRLTASGWGGKDNRGNGTVRQVNTMSGGTVAVLYDAVGAATNFSARVSTSPNSFYQTFTSVVTVAGAARAGENLTSTQYIDNTTTRGQAEIGHVVPRGYVGARVAAAHATADFTEIKPAATTSMGLRDDSEALSAQAAFTPFARLTLGAGVRREWRAAPTSNDARDAATVGRLTSSFRASKAVVFRGSVATSHRWPTLNELVRGFQVGAVLTQANADLRPERGRSGDVAVTVTRRAWDVSAGGFWSVVRDAIANVTLTPTLRQRRNAGEAHARGAELDGSLRAGPAVRLRASATFSDATFRHSVEPPLEGKRLPQVPRLSGALSADVSLPRATTASFVWHAASRQFDDDRNTFLLADAYQFDARLQGRLGAFGWHLDLENAFDRRIETGRTPLVTVAPGRNVRVGVNWHR
jgi:iron complex outermembrane receptor protein